MSKATQVKLDPEAKIKDLMKGHRITFSGMNPGGYYISLCGGKYQITISEYMGAGALDDLEKFIARVDWDEVTKYYGK